MPISCAHLYSDREKHDRRNFFREPGDFLVRKRNKKQCNENVFYTVSSFLYTYTL